VVEDCLFDIEHLTWQFAWVDWVGLLLAMAVLFVLSILVMLPLRELPAPVHIPFRIPAHILPPRLPPRPESILLLHLSSKLLPLFLVGVHL
jgi:hypothetical protein